MSEALPRRSDDERLIAVGRALAQSLLGGTELATDPSLAGPPLSEHSFIPQPSGVEPGVEVMVAPVRRRRRATTGGDGPNGHGAAAPPVSVDPFAVVAPLTPRIVMPPPVIPSPPSVNPAPASALSSDAVVVDAALAFDETAFAPRADEPAATDPQVAPARSDLAPALDQRLEFLPLVPEAAAPSVEIEVAPRTVAVPEPVEVSGFVTQLYRTLPFSPDEPEVQRKRLLRRPAAAPARPVVPRPDESTIRMPDLRRAAPAGLDADEDRQIVTHIAEEWRGRVASAEPEIDEEGDGRGRRSAAFEWLLVIAAAFAVALLLKFFVVQSFSIPSESMVSTLEIGDRVAVNKLAYEIGGDVERFDVVVFHHVDVPGASEQGMPEFLIKRVIGLPGETIEARGGIVYVNGEPLDEGGHLAPDAITNNLSEPIQVPPGEYFMMGDNRERSADSRVFGTVPRDKIVGRAVAIWWPVSRAGSL